MHHSAVLSVVFCVFTAAAQDAPKPQFTARELFYSAAAEPAAPAKPAPTPAAPAPKPAVAARRPPVQPPAQPPVQSAVQPPVQPAAATPPSQPPSQPPAQSTQPIAPHDGVVIIKAAMVAPAPETGTPLGLKYTILKKSGDDMVEVPSDTVFHTGDRIQVSVQTNSPGYLYVVSHGPSGTWYPIFPSPEVADGNNHVDGWGARTLPPGSRIQFREPSGSEQLFIVFSRTPEEGLENMIYSLQDPKPRPAADKEPDKPARKFVLSASAEIPDSTVGRLHDTYTRDLIVEKVDDKTPADKSSANKQENAVYVVNPSGSSDSRVVATIDLVHQ